MADRGRNNEAGKVRQITLDPNRAARVRQRQRDSRRQLEKKRKNRRKRRTRLLLLLAILAVIAGMIFLLWRRLRTFDSITIKNSLVQEDQQAVSYRMFDEQLLKIGTDGATYMSRDGDVIWKESYSIQNPLVDVNGGYAVIAGKDDTQVLLYNQKGKVTQVKTTLPVSKVRVSAGGMMAVIMADEQVSWVRIYNEQAEMVAESKSTLTGSGYPVDVALGSDGLTMMVAYHSIAEQALRSQVAFYQFGAAGKTEVDNLVSGSEYRDHVVPEVGFLSGGRAYALRDNGFSVFQGAQIPVQTANVELEEPIEAACHDDEHIVLIVATGVDGQKQYQARIYQADGDLQKEVGLNENYTSCHLLDGKLVLVKEQRLTVMTLDGKIRFDGEYSSSIRSIFAGKGEYSYVIIGENTVDHVKLQ